MTFNLSRDTLSPDLARKLRVIQRPRTLFEAGAKAVQRGIVTHLRKLQARGNEKGWPSQGFFAGGRNSVEKNVGISRLDETGAVITIADPRFVHRIEGGTVTAKRRRFLAIPLNAAAYALSGQGTLAEIDWKARGAQFAFRRSVTHRPRPHEAPDQEVLSAEAGEAMRKAADILMGVAP
jgi:hypothetical protein